MDDVLKNVSHDSLLYKEESTKVLTFVILVQQHISEVWQISQKETSYG